MILLHLKIFRNNFFIIVSNSYGNILFMKNSGNVGFKNANKCSLEALKIILSKSLKFIISLNTSILYLKVEVSKKYFLYAIYKQFLIFFKRYYIIINILKVVNKISYSGLRKPL